MAVLQEFKCPCCDGAIVFDSGIQKMKCPYCSTEFEMADLLAYDEALKGQPEENMQWSTEAGQQWQSGDFFMYCNTIRTAKPSSSSVSSSGGSRKVGGGRF